MSVRWRLGVYGVHAVVGRGHRVCPLVGGCSLVRVSIIRGFTVIYYSLPSQRVLYSEVPL